MHCYCFPGVSIGLQHLSYSVGEGNMAHTLYICFPKSPLILLPFSDITVGFQQVSYSVREADDRVMVCAILTGDTQREVLVNLTTLSGSALG